MCAIFIPSHATGPIFLYNISDGPCPHIPYCSKLYVCVSILAYTQQFHGSFVRLAVFVMVNSRASCLLTPCTHLSHFNSDNTRSIYSQPFIVLERNQLLLHFASTNNQQPRYALSMVYATWYGASLCSSV